MSKYVLNRQNFKRSFPLLLVVAFSLTLLMSLASTPVKDSDALSGSAFDAGRIIDDAVFYNGNSMTASQIQQFLNAKVPTCDTNGEQWHWTGRTRAEHGIANGVPPPYTCLKNKRVDTPFKAGVSGQCSPMSAKSNISAAQVIDNVARACGVSQKVLLVLLQKEQSLVTDDWPWPIQYRSATGYGCPDTAPCDSEYYGFFNQVYQAAKAYKRYRANPANYNYRAGRTNTILWHPNTGCGTSNVYIQNQATAGLYIYTPYRPNAAALNNLYGTGDSCSSYGNRNFWRMYNDWFGSTYATAYSATPHSSWSSGSTSTMVKGDRVKVVFKVRNTGNVNWSQSNTFLATASPNGRASRFRDGSWPSSSRVAKLKETSVYSGEIGTFEFWYKAPDATGTFKERFTVVLEGQSWIPYSGLFLTTNVVNPSFSAKIVSAASNVSTSSMAPGEKAQIVLKVKNIGNRVWKNSGTNRTRLATASPYGRGSAYAYGWLTHSRVSEMDQSSVAPGQTASFRFYYRAPGIFGTHKELFTLVHEGKAWSSYFGVHFNTTVSPPEYSAQALSSYSSIATGTMTPGTTAGVAFRVKNTGNKTWYKNNTFVATAKPNGRHSGFNNGSWPSKSRAARLRENSVPPGGVGTFEFSYRAPNISGTHKEHFTVVIEGKKWVPYFGLFIKTTIP